MLAQLPAERIVAERDQTRRGDERVRAEVAAAIAEINALVRRHNLEVSPSALHLHAVTLEGLLEIARAPHA